MQTDEVARRDRPIEAQSPLLSHQLASSNCTRRRHTHDDDDNDDDDDDDDDDVINLSPIRISLPIRTTVIRGMRWGVPEWHLITSQTTL